MKPFINGRSFGLASILLAGCVVASPAAMAERESVRSANRPVTRDIKINRDPQPRGPANVDIDNRRNVDVDVDKRRDVNVDIDKRRDVDVDIDKRRSVNVDVDVDHRHGVYWRYDHTVVVGAVVKTVPANRVVIVVGGTSYFYAGGIYYVQGPSGFVVVASPVGAVITTLPAGCLTITAGTTSYFYYNGTYYVRRDNGYIVVAPPIGVRVAILPAGASRVVVNGVVHYQHGGIYYRPSFVNGVTVYTTVRL